MKYYNFRFNPESHDLAEIQRAIDEDQQKCKINMYTCLYMHTFLGM